MRGRSGNWPFYLDCECHNPTGELCSKWPEIATAAQKINVDNKANFRYPDDYSFRLMQASICWAEAIVVKILISGLLIFILFLFLLMSVFAEQKRFKKLMAWMAWGRAKLSF